MNYHLLKSRNTITLVTTYSLRYQGPDVKRAHKEAVDAMLKKHTDEFDDYNFTVDCHPEPSGGNATIVVTATKEQTFQPRVKVPQAVYDGIEKVRVSGLTNMLDRREVARIARQWGYAQAYAWLTDHNNYSVYSTAVFYGIEPETTEDHPDASH